MKNITFFSTAGIREAIRNEIISDSEDIYIDRPEGTYCVAFSTKMHRHLITLDEILFCQPTGELMNGKKVLEAVPSDIDPKIIYNDLVAMFGHAS